MNDASKIESVPRRLSAHLDAFQKEIYLVEHPRLLGLFTMKNRDSRGVETQCSIYQTAFSLYIVFDDKVIRADQPYEFREVAPRKSPKTQSDKQLRTYKLKFILAGQNQTFIMFRHASLDKMFHVEQTAKYKNFRFSFLMQSFIDLLAIVEEVINSVNAQALQLNLNSKSRLTMQMFIDALYSDYITTPEQLSKRAHENPFANTYLTIVGPMQAMILRHLLEYGMSPNQYGCFGQGLVIRQDVDSGSSSRPGITLDAMCEIIKAINPNLAIRFNGLVHQLHSFAFFDANEMGLNNHYLDDDLLDL